MPGRGPQTFKKRQKEQQRKERQQEKMAKRLGRKQENPAAPSEETGEASADLDVQTETAEPNADAAR